MCFCIWLTVLQAHPQLFVVFLLHVIDDLALVLEGVGLLDAGHEVSLDHRVRMAVEQVTIWKILTQAQKNRSKAELFFFLATRGLKNSTSW